MIFSHISDTHLGLMQYGLEERENDMYAAFNESVDVSIKDHVDFVIFAGDIFHVPNPSGMAIIQMANALKRLKQGQIEAFFVLGEHDISRIRSTPIPYVYHNLEYARYVGHGRPVIYKGAMIAGFDKIRKGEMPSYYDRFSALGKAAKDHVGHKILVMHQGISEINKFAGEINSTDLPKNFTYYAMGHLHDQSLKQFSHLSGPVAYPGSTEMTTSEGIKDSQKGFYEVDISRSDAAPSWIKLDTRPQMSQKTEFDRLEKTVSEILEKISKLSKKPIVEIKISGESIESDIVQNQMARLAQHTLHYVWRLTQNNDKDSSVLLDRPASIDDELVRLATNCLGKTDLASFAIKDLLPLLSSSRTEEAGHMIAERFEQFKRSK